MKIELLLMLWLIMIILGGCGNNEEEDFRSMQQIHQTEGIPVRIRETEYRPFTISYSYNANLSGIKETTLNSSVSDRIETVHVSVGDYVEKDQLLVGLPEDNPQGQYVQAKLAYESSKSSYNRMKALYEVGGISEQDFEQLETSMKVNRANYDAAAKAIKVRAPFAGYVSKVFVTETENVAPGEALVTLTVLDKYKTKVWATEDELSDINRGNEAVARWRGNVLPGKVTQVAHSLDAHRQAFIIDLEFDNPQLLNISGVMANIKITAYHNDEAIAVPRQYIHAIADNKGYVFLAVDNKAYRQEVALGRTDGLRYEIKEGLIPGDRLITEGTNAVEHEDLIRIMD